MLGPHFPVVGCAPPLGAVRHKAPESDQELVEAPDPQLEV